MAVAFSVKDACAALHVFCNISLRECERGRYTQWVGRGVMRKGAGVVKKELRSPKEFSCANTE